MNIKNFITNIFSSSSKERKIQNNGFKDDKQATLSNKSTSNQSEEDLLSNLRKSKLFFDDTEIGFVPRRDSPSYLKSIEEMSNSQAFLEPEKRVGLIPNSVSNIILTTPSKLERKEISLQNERPSISDFINSLKKGKAEEPLDSQKTDPLQDQGCIFFDRKTLVQNLPNSGNKMRNQTEEPLVLNAHSNGLRDNYDIRRSNETHQKLMNAFSFNEDVLPAVSLEFKGRNEAAELSHINRILPQMYQSHHQQQQMEVSQRQSSQSSRVRGSSSKKKSMLSESPLSTKGKREISSVSLSLQEKYPQLDQIRENIQMIGKYQPSVNEDVDGENEIVYQDNMHIINLNEFVPHKGEAGVAVVDNSQRDMMMSSQKLAQSECLSNRAEPPTQAKQRSNSFFFEFSADKRRQIQHESESKVSDSSSSSNKSARAMIIESPLVGSDDRTSQEQGDGVSVFNRESDAKSKSNGSSPSRNSLHMFHKKIDMMIDKSEILPPSLTRSAHKLPSPIKEVDELSQKNHRVTPKRGNNQMEVMENNEEDEDGSPKMRQKSVKFNNTFTPCGNPEDSEEHKHNLKLQSRKPTPYNPFKQAPQSYLSRQNKFRQEENSSSNGDHNKVHANSSSNGDHNIIRPNFSSNGDHNIIRPNSSSNGDHNIIRPNSSSNGDHNIVHANSSCNGDHNQVCPDSSSNGDYNIAHPNSSSNGDQNVAHPNSSFLGTVLFTSNGEDSEKPNLPIFKDMETPNIDEIHRSHPSQEMKSNNLFEKTVQVTKTTAINDLKHHSKDTKQISNEIKHPKNDAKQSNRSTTPHPPPSHGNKLQKQIQKLPLALQRKDFVAQMNNHESNTFFKSENTQSTPLILNAANTSGSTNSSSSNHSVNNGSHSNGFIKNNKKRLLSEDQALLSEFAPVQRLKLSEESSLPLPRPMRATIQNGVVPAFGIKSAYKTCIFCKSEIKLKEEIKTFTCCHKAHFNCLPKDRNVKCIRCNSNNMLNKYRPKE